MSSSTSNSKRYLIVTLSVVLLNGGFFVVASEWLLRVRVAPNQNIERHAEFFRSVTRSGAAFGDSHVAMSIVGDAEIANLGFPGDSLQEVIGKAKLYFTRIPPGKVLLQADPQQLAAVRLNKSFDPIRSMFDQETTLLSMLKLSVPIYRNNILGHWQSFLNGAEFRALRTFDPVDGSQTTTTTFADWSEDRVRDFVKRILTDQIHVETEASHPTLQQYKNLIQWLTARGAQVCLVAYPVSQPFIAVATGYNSEKSSEALYKKLSAETAVKYVNFRRNRYPNALFHDPDHLNKNGALLFTPEVHKACFK
jgi:hypothetical protein